MSGWLCLDHGWQLGEHGEWCKHTNFEYAARAPMMVHVPGLTDSGVVTEQFTEHVDLFPTLTEAAMGIKMPVCPQGDASFKVTLDQSITTHTHTCLYALALSLMCYSSPRPCLFTHSQSHSHIHSLSPVLVLAVMK